MEDPRLLILDEPFNGLDKHGVAQIRELLLELKAAGKTILLASHNEEDIRILCDHVYEMDGGSTKACLKKTVCKISCKMGRADCGNYFFARFKRKD